MPATAEKRKKVWIPKISDERLLELSARIKPVFMFERKGLCYIKPVDLRGVAYTWDPKPDKRATGLKTLCEITTYHSYGHPSMFKPSIAEVISQIPKRHLEKVVAFEIVDQPESATDLNASREALNAGYHVASTRLYTR